MRKLNLKRVSFCRIGTVEVSKVFVGARQIWPVACSVEGCGRPTKARGLCNRCYLRVWKDSRPKPPKDLGPKPKLLCSVEGCNRPMKSRTLCNMHYLQKWKAGELPEQVLKLCSIEGCGRRHKGRGLCSMHIQRKDPWAPKPVKQPKPVRRRRDDEDDKPIRRTHGPIDVRYDESAFTFTRAEILKARGYNSVS